MTYYKIKDETLKGIANAIREKSGTEDVYTPGQMAAAIEGIQTGAALNIAYGDSEPEDTGKLWVKTAEPTAVQVTSKIVVSNEEVASFIAALPEKRISAASAAIGTKIYLFGGKNNTSVSKLDSIRVFDTETNTVTALDATLPKPLYDLAAAAVGTKIYLFGGMDADGAAQNSIHVFDTETNTIATLDVTIPSSLFGSSAVAVGSRIYLFGGAYTSGNYWRALSYIHVFDTELCEIFRLSAGLPTKLLYMAAAAVGTKIYLLGGYYIYNTEKAHHNAIHVFDTETSTISTLSVALPNMVSRMASAAVGTKIYLLGGGADTDSNTIIRFDTEAQEASTLAETLATSIYGGTASAVGTRIYLFGGYGSQGYDTGIHEFVAALPLAENTLLIEASSTENMVELIAGNGAAVQLGVANAYLGNAEGKAEKVPAAVYKDGAWVEI